MGAGRGHGQVVRTEGAWLVTKHEDGANSREPLLTFNPFARQGYQGDGPGTGSLRRRAAWHRERARFRRANQDGRSNNGVSEEDIAHARRAG